MEVYGALALPPKMDSQVGSQPMYVRATPVFHKKEWFRSVVYERDANDEECSNKRYGQLRVLLKCFFTTIENEIVEKDLALLRVYRFLSDDGVLKCPIITWEVDPNRSYVVIEVSHTTEGIQVIPHFLQTELYFVNKYKF